MRGGVELAALSGVLDGGLEGQLAGSHRGTVQGDAALDEGAQHGEEATALAGNGRGVGPVGVNVAVPVEQVGPRYADVAEVQPAVVDAVQPALDAVVLSTDARQELLGLRVPQVHVERVDPVVHAAGH
ncbi:hypothetical protein D9M72_396960 [compost metagenome]